MAPSPITNVRRQKGVYVEIVISAGKVASEAEKIKTPQAARARRIANYLPRPELRVFELDGGVAVRGGLAAHAA
ncbi:hypothetical protein GCM10022206_85950 [Streptomyces chiangmaiensis]